MKIIILGASPKSLVNFRGDLIKELTKNPRNQIIAMACSATDQEKKEIERNKKYIFEKHIYIYIYR